MNINELEAAYKTMIEQRNLRLEQLLSLYGSRVSLEEMKLRLDSKMPINPILEKHHTSVMLIDEVYSFYMSDDITRCKAKEMVANILELNPKQDQ